MTRIFSTLRRAFTALLLILPIVASSAAAQHRYEQIALRYDRPSLHHEAIVLPGEASAQAVVAFRIPHSLLVFVQEGDGFLAQADVTVGLYRNGTKVDEKIWKGKTRASTFAETSSSERDLTGRVVFDLNPGSYAYRVTLAEAKARGSGPWQAFRVPEFNASGIGPPFFARPETEDSSRVTLEPAILGGSVPFGSRVPLAIPLTYTGSNPVLEYRLYRRGDIRALSDARTYADARAAERGSGRRDAERPDMEDESIELTADDRLLGRGIVDLETAVPIGSIQTNCFCWTVDRSGSAVGSAGERDRSSSADAFGRLASVDLRTDTLENGAYVLELTLQTDEETLRHRTRFSTLWRDMPLSLYDVEVAIRNLSFIESRDRIREMLRGSREDRIEAFRSYWKQRDPSPGTVVNELMQEYYERIDRAASEFRTGRTPYPDGLRTDAARVFVVHGPPEDISSSFPSTGGVQQVWTYADGRQFVFWAASSLEPLVLEESSPRANGGSGGGL